MTAEPRRIEADTAAAGALRRRCELGWAMEKAERVRVTNPAGGSWTGRIVGLSDHPAMLLERDDGRRVMLPQCFAVEEINPVEAAAVAARFAGVEIDAATLELIATAVLGHTDNRLGTRQAVDRHMWENEGYRDHHRQAMRRELHEAVTAHGYVPAAFPSETLRYLKMAPPSFGGEVPESADWDTIEITLEVPVRTPPVDRAEAVRRGLLTGTAPAFP